MSQSSQTVCGEKGLLDVRGDLNNVELVSSRYSVSKNVDTS